MTCCFRSSETLGRDVGAMRYARRQARHGRVAADASLLKMR